MSPLLKIIFLLIAAAATSAVSATQETEAFQNQLRGTFERVEGSAEQPDRALAVAEGCRRKCNRVKRRFVNNCVGGCEGKPRRRRCVKACRNRKGTAKHQNCMKNRCGGGDEESICPRPISGAPVYCKRIYQPVRCGPTKTECFYANDCVASKMGGFDVETECQPAPLD